MPGTPEYNRNRLKFKGQYSKAGGGFSKELAIKRFWEKVNKNGPLMRQDLGPCWEWMGVRLTSKRKQPYGKVSYGGYGKEVLAHRLSWFIHTGVMPQPSTFICHKCDYGLCVNPDHLFDGTATDNNRDMFQKGRGSNPPRHDVQTVEQVLKIREEYAKNELTFVQMAEKFGTTVKRIECALMKWKHLPKIERFRGRTNGPKRIKAMLCHD